MSLTEIPIGNIIKYRKIKNRDKYLESLGFTVLRFENRCVFQEPEHLKDEIRKVIKNEKVR